MSNFPKWLLALAGINVVPLLMCVLFLFGGVLAPPAEAGGFVKLTAYVGTQLLWLLPVASIFAGLDRHFRGWERTGTAIIVAGNVLTVADVLIVCLR